MYQMCPTKYCCTDEPCPAIINSKCVTYAGETLTSIGVNTNDSLQTVIQKINIKVGDILTNCCGGGGSGEAIWGGITGTVTNQTDLVNYVSSRVSGLYDDRGGYNPTLSSSYPTSGGSGTGGGILRGDIWWINTPGILDGVVVEIGDTVRALIDSPGISSVNWSILTHAGESETLFENDVTFILSSDKSFGKYKNGDTAPWEGLNAVEAILDASLEYIIPTFPSFTISGPTTVEVGTTLPTSRTATWTVIPNSGTIPTIDIFDITSNTTLVSNTPNDGSQSITINTIQLNSPGQTQQWRGIANNTNPTGTINSPIHTITARLYRFFGPSSSIPNDSTSIRALPNSVFQVGTGNFILNTGNVELNFVIAIPSTLSISLVMDLEVNANITSEYILFGTTNVVDAGGNNQLYKVYAMTTGIPYSENHRHQVTLANA